MTDEDRITLSSAALREMMEDAAEQGARRTLARLGLDDEKAVADLREVRDMLSAWRTARKVMWETTIRIVTTVMLGAIALGLILTGLGSAMGWLPPRSR